MQRAGTQSKQLDAARLAERTLQLVQVVPTCRTAVDDSTPMRSERGMLKEKLANANRQLPAMREQVEALTHHLTGRRKADRPSSRLTSSATNRPKSNILPVSKGLSRGQGHHIEW